MTNNTILVRVQIQNFEHLGENYRSILEDILSKDETIKNSYTIEDDYLSLSFSFQSNSNSFGLIKRGIKDHFAAFEHLFTLGDIQQV